MMARTNGWTKPFHGITHYETDTHFASITMRGKWADAYVKTKVPKQNGRLGISFISDDDIAHFIPSVGESFKEGKAEVHYNCQDPLYDAMRWCEKKMGLR